MSICNPEECGGAVIFDRGTDDRNDSTSFCKYCGEIYTMSGKRPRKK